MCQTAATTLISSADPAPVEVIDADSRSDLVLLCEHAGRAVPGSLGTLGVDADVLNSHRGWDIGAEDVARRLARALQAPLVIQRYSRLVIDCNRPPGSAESIPVISDHREIPGNRDADQSDKDARLREIFDPMDQQIRDLFKRQKPRATFSIHSFTPSMDGFDRPWHAGFLTRRSISTADALISHILSEDPKLSLALNKPYTVDDDTDWFIPRYAERLDLPHCLIEIRNDQIDHPEGAELWAGLLFRAIAAFMESLT